MKHFAVRTWNGHVWVYFYLGPLRLTLLDSYALRHTPVLLFFAVVLGIPLGILFYDPSTLLDVLQSLGRLILQLGAGND